MLRLLATDEQMLHPTCTLWSTMFQAFYWTRCRKNNDAARSTVLRKSNKWDGPADVLKHEARLWELKHRQRPKRNYTKKNDQYWEYELGETRRNKRKTKL